MKNKRVTVQGPEKKPQMDDMLHRGLPWVGSAPRGGGGALTVVEGSQAPGLVWVSVVTDVGGGGRRIVPAGRGAGR